jgi:hypothetical protein
MTTTREATIRGGLMWPEAPAEALIQHRGRPETAPVRGLHSGGVSAPYSVSATPVSS